MDPLLQKRYFELRKQLVALNYNSNFGVEAIDVVQQLFTDLISTTDSYTQLQEKESKLSSDLSHAQVQLFPLRKENAKLMRENQQLHLETISLQEQFAKQQSELQLKLKDLESANKELEFVCHAKDAELKRLETDRNRLRQTYEQLASSSIASNGIKIKRSMKSTGAVSSAVDDVTVLSPRESSKYNMQVEESIINTLHNQVASLSETIASLQSKNAQLEASLERREDELLKATRSEFVGGATSAATDLSNKRIIDQLNTQVDFLNEQLAGRERQLGEMQEQVSGVEALRVECDYRGVLIEELKKERGQLHAQLRVADSKLLEVRKIGQNQPESVAVRSAEPVDTKKMDELSAEVKQWKEKEQLAQDVIRRLRIDIDTLNSRISRLQSNEDVKASSPAPVTPSVTVSSTTEADLRFLSNEYKILKDRYDSLQQEFISIQRDRDALKQAHDKLVTEHRATQLHAQDAKHRSSSNIEIVLAECQQWKSEADRCKETIQRLRSELSRQEKKNADPAIAEPSAASEAQITSLQSDLQFLHDEHKQLQVKYEDLQQELVSSQQLISLLKEAHQKIQSEARATQLRAQETEKQVGLVQIEGGAVVSVEEVLAELRHWKMKHESAQSTIERLRKEVDGLSAELSRQHNSQEISTNHTATVLQQYHDALTEISQRDNALSALQLQLSKKDSHIASQENHLRHLQQEIAEHHNASEEQRAAAAMLRSENQRLQTEVQRLKNEILTYRNEIASTSANADSLARNTQHFQTQLDEYARKNSSLQQELLSRDNELSDAQQQIAELNNSLHHANEKAKLTASTMQTLQDQVAGANKKYTDVQSNLTTMQSQLQHEKSAHRRTQMQVQEYLESLEQAEQKQHRLELELSHKAQEISDLKNTIRQLDDNSDLLQAELDDATEALHHATNTVKQHEEKLNTANAAVSNANQKYSHLEQKYATQTAQYDQLLQQYHTCKQEVVQLNSKIQSLQSSITHHSNDLMLMTKENQSLTAELANVSYDRDKLRMQLEEMQSKYNEMQYSFRALEMERDELLTTYRTTLQEKRRLENDLNTMSGAKQKLAEALHEERTAVARLTSQIEGSQSRDARVQNEKLALQRQIEALNDQLVRAMEKCDAVSEENRKIYLDKDALQQTIKLLNERIQSLLQRAASISDANKILSSRLQASEEMCDKLRRNVGHLQQKNTDMSTLLSTARTQHIQSSVLSKISRETVPDDTPKDASRFGSEAATPSYYSQQSSNMSMGEFLAAVEEEKSTGSPASSTASSK